MVTISRGLTSAATGARPVNVTSAEGPVDFVYDQDAVLTQVRYGDDETVRTVRHEDGEATADDAAGALLDDLFDERGRFAVAGGRTSGDSARCACSRCAVDVVIAATAVAVPLPEPLAGGCSRDRRAQRR